MPAESRTIRILVASPSDVAAKRKAAGEVIRGWAAPDSDVVLAPGSCFVGATPRDCLAWFTILAALWFFNAASFRCWQFVVCLQNYSAQGCARFAFVNRD